MEQARTARWLTCVTAVVAAFTLALVARADAQDLAVTIDGFAVVGETLTAVVEPADSIAKLQWLRCTADDKSACTEIGATGASYVVTEADMGRWLAVRAREGGDSDLEFTAVVTPSQPPSISSVTFSGQPIVGEPIKASATVSGNPPPTVGYQWLRCPDDPLACTPIAGATQASYDVSAADARLRLGLDVTAQNSSGTVTTRSALTNPVQQAPAVTSVTIAGQAVIGDMLTAKATATGFPAPTIQYRWLRCPADPDTDCQPIADATEASYAVEPADAAHTLVARATATNPAGADTARSAPTAAVPEPGLGDVFEQLGAAPVSGALGTSTSGATRRAKARYLRPFPVVRIKGVLVVGGAQVTLLRVKAPRGSRVNVRCRRSGCRLRGRNIGVGRIQALERFLPAGARITIRVVKRGFIGKYVRIVIRDGRLPVRRDACLLPGKRKPVRCPRP